MEKDFPARPARGFTLVELLVAVAIAAVVLGLAVPAWGRFVAGVRVATATTELVSGLHAARSEAIKRQHRVTLCKSADGTSCASDGGWEQGWMMFADADNFGVRDAGESVVRISTGEHDGLGIQGNSEFARFISYTPMGTTRRASGALGMGSMTVCSSRAGVTGRRVVISRTGRARVERTGCQ